MAKCQFLKRQPKVKFSRVLFVDPGFFTGFTYWLPNNFFFGLLRIKNFLDINRRFNFGWDGFRDILEHYEPNLVYFEDVEFRANSLKSMTSAKRGDLLKLDRLLGGYMGECNRLHIDYKLIKAINWKGNLTDEQVSKRVKWLTGKTFLSQHITDSFGMSLSVMGIFK